MADNNSTAAPAAANSNQATSSNRGSSSQGFRGRGGGGRRGNRGGRGGTNRPQRGRGDARKGPNPRGADRKRDMGRGDYQRNHVDRRTRIEETQASKRQKMEDGEATHLEAEGEEVQGEARKPKRKVAVMVGYAGTGYKGMQINSAEKTIEGELFKAFVAAGAISKANADDPKKSSLVRCARTDKGVHAAGNVISLKLIVEDPNTVQNINEHLPSQIRVWGIERTNGSFSCYQTCDSRWYEYLIPTYSFLPPHPQSYLGRELVQAAEKEGVYESYQARQEDVATFWEEAQKKYVEPILEKLDPDMRAAVMAAVLKPEEDGDTKKSKTEGSKVEESKIDPIVQSESDQPETTGHQEEVVSASEADQMEVAKTEDSNSVMKTELAEPKTDNPQENNLENVDLDDATTGNVQEEVAIENESKEVSIKNGTGEISMNPESTEPAASKSILTPLEAAIKEVKAAMITAKKAYRISPSRRQAVQDALNVYLGTRNFHNYTIQKPHSDPSAKRVIRSFKVHKDPVIINDTEWLSLKVHGQSFMMHQIRKMVAMVALVVRCGSGTGIMLDSYGPANISIPKAPSLGLLLEKPVFETYNERAQRDFNREKIDFDNYEKEMDEFKQREIYDRIFREEEKDHQFHTFFNHIDHYRSDYFLWVTASGLKAAAQNKVEKKEDDDSDNEADANGEEG